MSHYFLRALFLAGASGFLTGCGTNATAPEKMIQNPAPPTEIAMGRGTNAAAPEKMILFSIDGTDRDPKIPVEVKERFYNYPVLGKIDTADPEQRVTLVNALKDAQDRRPKDGAKCFWPRHALSIIDKGKKIDYIICFECKWFTEYVDGTQIRHETINSDVQPIFDKMLKDAGIPLGPKN
jgi:hypothetical protein